MDLLVFINGDVYDFNNKDGVSVFYDDVLLEGITRISFINGTFTLYRGYDVALSIDVDSNNTVTLDKYTNCSSEAYELEVV
ncbi:MAG TPA: hypothetical protein VK190_03310 [Pseudoneobacillus sp.]|jgi:hypothetical protein|nr:hypothetical protein [Pseudoneobacillus sp.]